MLVLALAFAFGDACKCGDGAKPLARVGTTDGEVERNPDVGKAWTAAATGDDIFLGGAVRTGAAARAGVDLTGGGGRLRLGELSIVRFARSERDAFRLDLQTGEAEIETGSVAIILTTPTGTVRLQAGTQARVIRGEDGLAIEIIVGSAEIEDGDAPGSPLAAGAAVTVTPNGIAAPAPAEDAGPPDPGGDQDVRIAVPGGTFISRSAGEADVTLPAGETATIHVVRPPVPVRVQFETACPDNGLLEVSPRKSFRARATTQVLGTGNAIATLKRGTHHYRVRCADGDEFAETPVAEGTLRVLRDTNKAPSPSAPHNDVEADGRSYTVMYQNRKPRITFRWTSATKSASGYVLKVRDARDRTKTFKRKTAEITVKSGALGEGRYTWWIETAGPGSTRSPISKLRIEFDNAAPAAYIRKPSPEQAWSGDVVRVEGTALRGSTVTAGGVELPLDKHYRFAANVTPPDDGTAIAIRIAHGAGGGHYYVRRRGQP